MSLWNTTDLMQANALVIAYSSRMKRWADTEHDLGWRLLEPMGECLLCRCIRSLPVPELTEEDEARDDHFACAHMRRRPGDEAYNCVLPLLLWIVYSEQGDLSVTRHEADEGSEAGVLLTREVVIH